MLFAVAIARKSNMLGWWQACITTVALVNDVIHNSVPNVLYYHGLLLYHRHIGIIFHHCCWRWRTFGLSSLLLWWWWWPWLLICNAAVVVSRLTAGTKSSSAYTREDSFDKLSKTSRVEWLLIRLVDAKVFNVIFIYTRSLDTRIVVVWIILISLR